MSARNATSANLLIKVIGKTEVEVVVFNPEVMFLVPRIGAA